VDRREFVSGVALGLLIAPLAAEAQRTGKTPRIGVAVPVEPRDDQDVAAFRQALRDLGYVDGQNIAVEYLYAHGRAELYPELTAQLVHLKVDVMVVGSPELTQQRSSRRPGPRDTPGRAGRILYPDWPVAEISRIDPDIGLA